MKKAIYSLALLLLGIGMAFAGEKKAWGQSR